MIAATETEIGVPGSIPGVTFPATTGNPGGYSLIGTIPVPPIAVAYSPTTDRIALIERATTYGGSDGTTNVYDFIPSSNSVFTRNPTGDMFCIGGAHAPDGTLYIAGGSPVASVGDAVRRLRIGAEWEQKDSAMLLQAKRWCKFDLT